MSPVLFFLVVALAVLLGLLALPLAVRSRGRLEFRAYLLEALAIAARRRLPLPPLVARLAKEQRGRRRSLLAALAGRLAEGKALSDAFGAARGRLGPSYVAFAIRAAEGAGRVSETLDALAEEADAQVVTRHRVALAAAYPLLLAGFLGFVSYWVSRSGVMAAWGAAVLPVGMGYEAFLVPASIVVVVVVLLRNPSLFPLNPEALLPGAKHGAAARMLRVVGVLTGAGLPLGEALVKAAPASGRGGFVRRAVAVAAALEGGEAPSRAWSRSGLPRAVVRRLSAGSSARLPRTFVEIAETLEKRRAAAKERFVRWLPPLVLLIFGVLLAGELASVYEWINQTRAQVMPW